MKRISYLIVILPIYAMLCLTSCKKGSQNGGTGNNDSTYFRINIDGHLWQADQVTAIEQSGVIMITGFPSNQPYPNFHMNIVKTHQSGQFKYARNGDALIYSETGSSTFSADSTVNGIGYFTISKLDAVSKRIEGTFYATVKDQNRNSRTLSDGQFKANYQ